MLVALLSHPAFSQDTTFGKGDAVEFQVLSADYDRGLAALKLTYELKGGVTGEEPAFDCRYGGMQAHPRAGVLLAIWDLEQGKVREQWVVYESVDDAKQCTPAAESARALAAAKEAFVKAGLDLEQPPTLAPNQAGRFAVPGHDLTFEFGNVRGPDMGWVYTALHDKGKLVWTAPPQSYGLNMAARLDLSVPMLLVSEEDCVAPVFRRRLGTMRGSNDSYFLTRPICLPR